MRAAVGILACVIVGNTSRRSLNPRLRIWRTPVITRLGRGLWLRRAVICGEPPAWRRLPRSTHAHTVQCCRRRSTVCCRYVPQGLIAALQWQSNRATSCRCIPRRFRHEPETPVPSSPDSGWSCFALHFFHIEISFCLQRPQRIGHHLLLAAVAIRTQQAVVQRERFGIEPEPTADLPLSATVALVADLACDVARGGGTREPRYGNLGRGHFGTSGSGIQ